MCLREQDKLTLRHTKARLIQTESQLKGLQWEHDQLERKFLSVQQERDALLATFEQTLTYVCVFAVCRVHNVDSACVLHTCFHFALFANVYPSWRSDVHERSGYKNAQLERKLAELTETATAREVQLSHVLQQTQLDPELLHDVTTKLELLLEQKNETIRQLQFELARAAKVRMVFMLCVCVYIFLCVTRCGVALTMLCVLSVRVAYVCLCLCVGA